MTLGTKDVLNNYSKVEYKATDGHFYNLQDLYPLCMQVSKEMEEKEGTDLICLDTGGPMTGCDFFIAKVVGKELHRKLGNGEWKMISPEVRMKDVTKRFHQRMESPREFGEKEVTK